MTIKQEIIQIENHTKQIKTIKEELIAELKELDIQDKKYEGKEKFVIDAVDKLFYTLAEIYDCDCKQCGEWDDQKNDPEFEFCSDCQPLCNDEFCTEHMEELGDEGECRECIAYEKDKNEALREDYYDAKRRGE